MASELSGPEWCTRFPASDSVDQLMVPFRDKVKRFLDALGAGDAAVSIGATYRPKQLARTSCTTRGRSPTARSRHARCRRSRASRSAGSPDRRRIRRGRRRDGGGMRHRLRAAAHFTTHARPGDRSGDRVGRGSRDRRRQGPASRRRHRPARRHEPGAMGGIGASFGVMKLASDPLHWSSDGH